MASQPKALGRARATTGVPALDDVLGGGIPRGAVVFVTGLPGAGKTILCEQALFANARKSECVLYVTTLSEPSAKMLQFSRDFGFFRVELFERSVRYADLGSSLRAGGTDRALSDLDAMIKEHRPEFLVIDSFKVFREYFQEIRDFRAFSADLMILLSTWEVTALLVGEYDLEDVHREPEFAIADGILHLSGTAETARQKRYLNVIKMRGADAFLGRHYYEITDDGIVLYPRMRPRVSGEYPAPTERINSAIGGFDKMLGGGIPGGGATLISGGTGSGKTLTGLSFAVGAALNNIPSLFVSFEESPDQLIRNCEQLGWDVPGHVERGLMHFMHVSPSELDIDRHAIIIKERAEAAKARVLVIDSITAFEVGVGEASVFKDYLWGIADYCKSVGITLILTAEVYSFFESTSASDRQVSYLADSIILLRMTEEDGELRRRINVLKMRGSDHDKALRELRIAPGGVAIVDGD